MSVPLYNQIQSNKRKSASIMIIFILLLTGLGYVFGIALDYGYSLFIIATIFAILSTGFSYFYSDKVALAMSSAKPIDKQKDQRLYRTVENLSIGAGIVPMPKVYVIEDPAINAFATGRNPKHSAVAVTRGALNKLENLELEGVIAHELSHINNYDILTMSIAVVLVGIIALVSEWFIRIQWFGGRDRENRSGGLMVAFAILGAVLAPTIAQLLKLALSRQREYLADSSSALLTRYPQGLANALRKIEMDQNELRRASTATAHLFISNPLSKGKTKNSKIRNLFSTHPPVEERIRLLENM